MINSDKANVKKYIFSSRLKPTFSVFCNHQMVTIGKCSAIGISLNVCFFCFHSEIFFGGIKKVILMLG